MFDCIEEDWRKALTSGSVEKYQQFLSERLEATASEHGFFPESTGIAAVDLERRLMSSLPHIACMISGPRQATNLGENLFPRCDAAPRPY